MKRTHRCLVAAALLAAGCGGAGSLPLPVSRPLPVDQPALFKRALAAVSDTLRAFYASRDDQPLWVRGDTVTPEARALLALAARVPDAGVQAPGDVSGADPAALELALTQMWLQLARALSGGRLIPQAIDADWGVPTDTVDPIALLGEAVAGGRLVATLEDLDRRPPGYAALQAELASYRAIAATGGWPLVSQAAGPTVGAPGAAVVALRARLAASGDLDPADEGLDDWDAALELALRRFQRRHGLTEDGILSAPTVRALNVPVEARLDQIAANLERWRWLPRELTPTYLMVNIPAFELTLVRGADTTRRRVILGRVDWRTPLVSSTITQVVVAPSWTVPAEIARQELIPRLRADTGFAERAGILIYRLGNGEPAVVDPMTVDWSTADGVWPYRLVQLPGPANPLGRVKFVFANDHAVYLHDTPAVDLFGAPDRALSHGCVRVERALDLAAVLLRDVPAWTEPRLRSAAAAWRTKAIRLPQPVPLHVVYFTAWVDATGALQFRDDLYGWDARLTAELAR